MIAVILTVGPALFVTAYVVLLAALSFPHRFRE